MSRWPEIDASANWPRSDQINWRLSSNEFVFEVYGFIAMIGKIIGCNLFCDNYSAIF